MKTYTVTVNGIAYDVTVEETTGRPARAAAPVYTAPAPVAAAPAPATQTAAPAAAECSCEEIAGKSQHCW